MPAIEVTPEIGGDATKRRVVGLLVVMAVFLIIGNAAAYVLLRRHPVNRTDWLVREKWHLLDHTHKVDTLILGDSSCSQAVDPAVLEPALGGTSLNLCMVGNMLDVGDVWMLSEYMRLYGKPGRVVIVHVSDAWSRTEGHAFAELLGKIDRPWGFWRSLQPPFDTDLGTEAAIATSRWVPFYSESTSLRRLLASPVLGFPPAFRLDSRTGFMKVKAANRKRVLADARGHLEELARQKAQHVDVVSEDNRRALATLSALASREQLDVTIVPAPTFEGLWSHPETQQRYHELIPALREALGAGSTVRVLDIPPATFPAEQMENVDHVVGAAAAVYTQWLVAALAAR